MLKLALADEPSDILWTSATGSGKSLVFQIIGLYRKGPDALSWLSSVVLSGTVIVICATLELEKSQELEVKNVCKQFGVRCAALGGVAERPELDQSFLQGDLRFGTVDLANCSDLCFLVFVTPEKLVSLGPQVLQMMKAGLFSAVVFDECHLASDHGWYA